ncbi:MAG: hypothetical protein JW908_17075 [Anaerolineales bacterium]|nr:hypothetical protein [Anaerolineales bacterium]
MTQPDIEKLMRQTRKYEFSDGLRDVQLAIMFALGGIAVWLSFEPAWIALVGKSSISIGRWTMGLAFLPLIILVLVVWGMLRLMKFLRQRWLWRESGMVKSVRWMVPRRVNVISSVIFMGGIILSLYLRHLGYVDDVFVLRMLWVATGWAFGYTLIGVGRHIGLPRYIWLGILGGIASTAMLFMPLPFGQAALVFGLFWCIILTVSGAITLFGTVPPMKDQQP